MQDAVGAHLLHELDASSQGAPSGYQVIQEDHTLPLSDCAYMHLYAVLAILQLIAGSYRLACCSRIGYARICNDAKGIHDP